MAENYVLLEAIHLSQSAATITFDNLPSSGYTDLVLKVSGQGTGNAINVLGSISFNGLTTNFTNIYLQGNGSTAGAFTLARYIGQFPDTTATANTFGSCEIYISNYTSSTSKSFTVDTVQENFTATAGQAFTQMIAGIWANNSAITSISLSLGTGSFSPNSTFSLYGVASTGTTPITAPFATGGNIVANDGTYWYHAFLSSGTFTPLKTLSCDILQIAGGGGGGGGNDVGPLGAGGGAGGLLAYTSQSLTATGYTVTIGAGGAGRATTNGVNGASSQFGALTASVGGGGGGGNQGTGVGGYSGSNGGSGGGGSAWNSGATGAGGSPTSGQGNAGGTMTGQGSNRASAGGGGAGAAAASSSTSAVGTAGGIGLNSISGYGSFSGTTTATSTGVSGYYAGGGGSINGNATANAGGTGGGGSGTWGGNGVAGTTNTGGGGGGGGNTGGNGGSGIVIIRYTMV